MSTLKSSLKSNTLEFTNGTVSNVTLSASNSELSYSSSTGNINLSGIKDITSSGSINATNLVIENQTQTDTNVRYTATTGSVNNTFETDSTSYNQTLEDSTKNFTFSNGSKGDIYVYDHDNDIFTYKKKVLTDQQIPSDFTNLNEFVTKSYVDSKSYIDDGNIELQNQIVSLQNKTQNIDLNNTTTNYTKINGDLDIDIVGIYGLIPAASSDYFAYGICSASSVLTTNYAYLAFDQINGTQWVSNGGYPNVSGGSYIGSTTTIVDGVPQLGEWVQIAFNGILETNKVAIEGHTKAPVSWVLAGSLDNQTWFTLRDETNYPITPNLVAFTYTLTRTKYVRLIARSTMVVNYPSVTIDFINIYGKLVVEISDGKISGEINAGRVVSNYIKANEISSNLITTTTLLASNVANKNRFSFTRNTSTNNTFFYRDEYINLRWDGSRDFNINKIYATDIFYATKVLSLNGTFNNGEIAVLSTGVLVYYRNAGTGFVSLIISSPSNNLPVYKIHFQLDTAVVTEYIHCIVEKC